LTVAAEIATIRRLYIGLRVRYKYYRKNIVVLVWPGAAHAPIAVYVGPSSVFRTTIGVCKFYPDRLRFDSTKAKNLFLSKNRVRSEILDSTYHVEKVKPAGRAMCLDSGLQ